MIRLTCPPKVHKSFRQAPAEGALTRPNRQAVEPPSRRGDHAVVGTSASFGSVSPCVSRAPPSPLPLPLPPPPRPPAPLPPLFSLCEFALFFVLFPRRPPLLSSTSRNFPPLALPPPPLPPSLPPKSTSCSLCFILLLSFSIHVVSRART